jgi:ferric-dicitrate binding protein FerR (iron transport regulator)
MNLTIATEFQPNISTSSEDLIWNTAVEWVMHEHAQLSLVEFTDLNAWLQADPAHLAAYEEASYLWKLTEIALNNNIDLP